jgi:hypothetical protein
MNPSLGKERTMNTVFHRLRSWIVLLGISSTVLPAAGGAQELPVAANLTIKKVYLKANIGDSFSGFGDTFENVFGPTTITCPGGGTCTVRVQISAYAGGIDAGEYMYSQVLLDGFPMQPGTVLWGSETFLHTATFTWILADVSAGTHTVETQFSVQPAGAYAWIAHRTLSIEVLKP